ncbi:MAG: glycolate oxidase subunit GlcE [Gammaproteobacteria bacterium]|nr:glycolate oxidase subunit GlcE [Gammaproteobacteria bacterium]
MTDRDCSADLREQVATHCQHNTPMQIVAGGSKAFYGNAVDAQPLVVNDHRGIVHYEPTELVLSARCGTPLTEIEQTLADNQQMLGFEPPHFTGHATLGGTIAAGLSGPARPFRGAARDFVLGVHMINGKAEHLRFGGEVMKNVAGYDLSRLLTGSLGTLGVLLDVSLKVLPRPEVEQTLGFELSDRIAIQRMSELNLQAFPISAACHDGERMYLRLSGNAAAVKSAQKQIGGEDVKDAAKFWHSLREMSYPFFQTTRPLWRLSLAAASAPLAIDGKQFTDWGGAQRWLVSDADPADVRQRLSELGGHATLFRNGGEQPVFQPLTGKLHELHINLKLAFDPHCLFNPGRMYPEF